MKLYDRAFNSQFTRRRRKNRIGTFWRDSNIIPAGVRSFLIHNLIIEMVGFYNEYF